MVEWLPHLFYVYEERGAYLEIFHHADIDTTLKIYAKVKDKESKREISETMNGIIPLKDYKKDNL